MVDGGQLLRQQHSRPKKSAAAVPPTGEHSQDISRDAHNRCPSCCCNGKRRAINAHTTCIWYVEVWELNRYFYPSAGGFELEKKLKKRLHPHRCRANQLRKMSQPFYGRYPRPNARISASWVFPHAYVHMARLRFFSVRVHIHSYGCLFRAAIYPYISTPYTNHPLAYHTLLDYRHPTKQPQPSITAQTQDAHKPHCTYIYTLNMYRYDSRGLHANVLKNRPTCYTGIHQVHHCGRNYHGRVDSLTRVTFRLWIATPKRDYTDKLLYHQALN